MAPNGEIKLLNFKYLENHYDHSRRLVALNWIAAGTFLNNLVVRDLGRRLPPHAKRFNDAVVSALEEIYGSGSPDEKRVRIAELVFELGEAYEIRDKSARRAFIKQVIAKYEAIASVRIPTEAKRELLDAQIDERARSGLELARANSHLLGTSERNHKRLKKKAGKLLTDAKQFWGTRVPRQVALKAILTECFSFSDEDAIKIISYSEQFPQEDSIATGDGHHCLLKRQLILDGSDLLSASIQSDKSAEIPAWRTQSHGTSNRSQPLSPKQHLEIRKSLAKRKRRQSARKD